MTLGGETMSRSTEEATIAEMMAKLSAEDASNFSKVIQEYLKANREISDGEMRALLALARRHTAERVRQAIARAATQGPVTIGQLQTVLNLEDPLLARVVRLCEDERIIEKGLTNWSYAHQELNKLVDEFDDFDWWQEAVHRAAADNKRRLRTVERILRDRRETGSWEPPWEQKEAEKQRGKTGQAKRGSQERGTQEIRRTQEKRGTIRWDEEELAKLRAQLPPDEWD